MECRALLWPQGGSTPIHQQHVSLPDNCKVARQAVTVATGEQSGRGAAVPQRGLFTGVGLESGEEMQDEGTTSGRDHLCSRPGGTHAHLVSIIRVSAATCSGGWGRCFLHQQQGGAMQRWWRQFKAGPLAGCLFRGGTVGGGQPLMKTLEQSWL